MLASALLGTEPPEMPVAQLVRLAGLFGVNENRARVALSRMVSAGEAVTTGDGRYRLSGRLLDRQARQRASRAAETIEDHGRWTMVVVDRHPQPAHVRAQRRSALRRARLAERREGVWLRPRNLELALDDETRRSVEVFDVAPLEDPSQLAVELFDLEGWAAAADELDRMLRAQLEHGVTDLADGFVLSAAVLRHLQADPLLPSVLLPEDWPGPTLRSTYDLFDSAYRIELARWHRAALEDGSSALSVPAGRGRLADPTDQR